MTDIQNSKHLETQREQIRNQFASIGDFRPGNLTTFYHKCGKPNCRCAKPEHPRHGSSWILTRKVESKTVTRGVPAEALEQARMQIHEHHRFQQLTKQLK